MYNFRILNNIMFVCLINDRHTNILFIAYTKFMRDVILLSYIGIITD